MKSALSDIEVISLWKKFHKKHPLDVKNKLIMHYIWLVKYVLQQMNLPSNSILSDEDFLNVGILGLHESIERFEADRGVKFESYAIPRIKGIIQDELRRLDWLSRTARRKAHEFINAGDSLRSEVGREVSIEEIRTKLNVSPEEYNSYLAAAAAAKASLYLSETSQLLMDEDDAGYIEEMPDTSQDSMQNIMEGEERITFLTTYLSKLNDQKKHVMVMYYYEDLTFKEIGEVMSVSESRICQIHSQVIGDLRTKLTEFDNA